MLTTPVTVGRATVRRFFLAVLKRHGSAAVKGDCKINAANLLRTETERPPRGGLSEIRSGVRFDMKKAAN
jgi:hypothetical protein